MGINLGIYSKYSNCVAQFSVVFHLALLNHTLAIISIVGSQVGGSYSSGIPVLHLGFASHAYMAFGHSVVQKSRGLFFFF